MPAFHVHRGPGRHFRRGRPLYHPAISEDGRLFLAGLLNRLSVAQIRQLFEAARVGDLTSVDADQWTTAFLTKRREINEGRCLDAQE